MAKTSRAPKIGMPALLAFAPKTECEESLRQELQILLQHYRASDLYLFIRQHVAALESALDSIKEDAIQGFADELGGATNGTVGIHKVSMTYPDKWIFPDSVKSLESQMKAKIDAAKAIAKADGTAKKEQGELRLAVTLTA